MIAKHETSFEILDGGILSTIHFEAKGKRDVRRLYKYLRAKADDGDMVNELLNSCHSVTFQNRCLRTYFWPSLVFGAFGKAM